MTREGNDINIYIIYIIYKAKYRIEEGRRGRRRVGNGGSCHTISLVREKQVTDCLDQRAQGLSIFSFLIFSSCLAAWLERNEKIGQVINESLSADFDRLRFERRDKRQWTRSDENQAIVHLNITTHSHKT